MGGRAGRSCRRRRGPGCRLGGQCGPARRSQAPRGLHAAGRRVRTHGSHRPAERDPGALGFRAVGVLAVSSPGPGRAPATHSQALRRPVGLRGFCWRRGPVERGSLLAAASLALRKSLSSLQGSCARGWRQAWAMRAAREELGLRLTWSAADGWGGWGARRVLWLRVGSQGWGHLPGLVLPPAGVQRCCLWSVTAASSLSWGETGALSLVQPFTGCPRAEPPPSQSPKASEPFSTAPPSISSHACKG